MVDILDVARYMLTLGPMKHRKLQILCFYAQVWHIVFKNEKFMDTDFEAWKNGPTSRRLYDRYRDWDNITISQTTYTLYALNLSESDKEFIRKIYKLYKNYSVDDLKVLSKKEFPYIKARGNISKDAPCVNTINNNLIKNFYTEMLEDAERV